MTDYIEGGDGKSRIVHGWIDEYGDYTDAENAVGAIGKNDDGSWWSVSFGDTFRLKKILTH
jgi:hypothetical protein